MPQQPGKKLTYRDAGLDLGLYEQSLAAMVPFLKRTHTPRVLDGFGGFASLFSLDYNSRLFAKNYRQPVLVSCTDGVGSKLKIAGLMGKHDTVGIDLVAMSVNDCLCTGGEPLLFLDYLAMPKDDPALIRDLIKGISDGCMEADCSLVGGETAILPDFYQPGDYDMAGFCVGVVERDRIINGKAIQARRRRPRPGQHRHPLQRLQPGPQGRLRACRAEDRRFRAGTGPHRRRGTAGADAHLRAAGQEHPAALSGEEARGPRPGPHHRRGTGRQCAARAAAGPAGVPAARQLADAAGVSAGCSGWATSSRRRWIASSTWASAS